jgi:glycosyltransferase involved in cell wall biosynthesis
MRLSIIINNYNYGRFAGQAIDSALALDWPDKEIIVADDGSADNSRAVILGYGARISPLLLPNGGQNSACNAAFERSGGDIVIFLDADDFLFPCLADTLRSAWSDRIAKLQWSLIITDENLRPLGPCGPTYPTDEPTPEWVRQSIVRTGTYRFSPTSGSAWARNFLRRVFPLPVREGMHCGGSNGDYRVPTIDHALSLLAPFFGDVVTISHHRPQGVYRIHGNNHSITADNFNNYADHSMEAFECDRFINDSLTRLNIAHKPINVEDDEYAMRRQLVCQRFELRPRRYSTLHESLWKYWRSVQLSMVPLTWKVKWHIWSLVVAVGPKKTALWAIRWRTRIAGELRPSRSLSTRTIMSASSGREYRVKAR